MSFRIVSGSGLAVLEGASNPPGFILKKRSDL